ncbi:MAG: 3-oxoacyl-ACP reductase FabG [Gammaproteobacteria bacterium]
MKLKDQTALVTGATRGIGQAILLELAKQGAYVIGTATSENGIETIRNTLKDNSFEGDAYILDVSNPESVAELVESLKENDKSPSILVNNAGVTRDNLLMRMKDDEWDAVIETNLTSVFRMSKAFLRGMMKARYGRVINIGSVVGLIGNPGQTNYCAAKAGMSGFTKSMAQEIASRGITVNLVAPGFIETDMTKELDINQRDAMLNNIPVGRMGDVNDIASAVSFLASEEAGFITGETLNVNGGMYMP